MEVKMIKIDKIKPNPLQPRKNFDNQKIVELSKTIKERGLLQPITVMKKDKIYQIISGERRWKAAKMGNLKEVPVIIKKMDKKASLVDSLIENLQREDLEPLEKAKGFKELNKLGLSVNLISLKLGVDRREIGRHLQFLELPKDIQNKIKAGKNKEGGGFKSHITPRHLQSILTIKNKKLQRKVINKVIKEKIPATEIDELTKVVKIADAPIREAILEKKVNPHVAERIMEINKPELQKRALEDAIKFSKSGNLTPEGILQRVEKISEDKAEMPQEPFNTKVFNKVMWNLERIEKKDFYTLGFGEWEISQFIKLLKRTKTKTLVDVRDTPFSQYKPEFNKNNLSKTMNENDIRYIHIPELGVPSEIRQKLAKTSDYEWFFNWYDKNILSNGILESKDFDSMDFPIAIMCTEFDPTKCHRHRIALALEKRGLKGFDL